jgi:ABC-type nickel/cobalt efflux system permease component RcnA
MVTTPVDAVRPARRFAAAILLAVAAAASSVCRADTVASLLGNFTINQFTGLSIADDRVEVRYAVVFGQLPALRELHAADADGDGVTTGAERDAYAGRLAKAFEDRLLLTVDGAAVPLRATRWTTSLPNEQGGFSLRLDIDYVGTMPSAEGTANRQLSFANQNYAGRFGWQEIVVHPSRSVAIFDTDAYSTSLTAGLTESPQTLPPGGPLAERAVRMTFSRRGVPESAQRLQPRPGTTPGGVDAAAQPSSDAEASWLARETRRIVDRLSSPDVPLSVALLALLSAAVLGALHAFAPGHGKTVVGAYLIGSRGTPRHALFLGATVTLTHTLGVFALGFATLVASSYIVPERLFPILSLVSGLIVLGMGVALLRQRWQGARAALSHPAPTRDRRLASAVTATTGTSFRLVGSAAGSAGLRSLSLGHEHHHSRYAHDDSHPHHHPAGGALTHSHGGRVHSHLPPGASGEPVTWRSLLALGISGGLVPCPSAMVLLLAAVALNKTAYGLLLVVAFSVGLASSLTAVGLFFLLARSRIATARPGSRWPQLLPVASAAVITLAGVVLCYGAVATAFA